MGMEQNPAIELLVAQIDELERKANAFKASVNVLCTSDGLPPRYPPDGTGGGKGSLSTPNGAASPKDTPAVVTQLTPDAFYGKRQQTVVREFLMMRKAAGLGPAKPGEILEGLKQGGYQVEAKSDEIALVGLRAMLRKRTAVFHKIPNGSWGLTEWYPNAKHTKEVADKPNSEKGAVASKETGAPLEAAEDTEESETADTTEASAA